MRYELHFKNHGGYTFSVSDMSARCDVDAIERARRVYRCGIGSRYEIWRDGILVHTEMEVGRQAAPSSV